MDEELDTVVEDIELDLDLLVLVSDLDAVRGGAVIKTVVCVVHIATPSAFVVVVIVLSTVIPNSL